MAWSRERGAGGKPHSLPQAPCPTLPTSSITLQKNNMNLVEYALPGEWINALGWTVLHSLWQAAFIALLIGVLLYRMQHRPSWQRYWLAHLGWLSIIVCAVITFITYYQPQGDPTLTMITRLTPEGEVLSSASPSFLESTLHILNDYFNQHLPLIVSLWAMGMVFFLLRFLGGLIFLQHLRSHRVQPLSADWERKLQLISDQLGLKRSVQLLESALVKVPMVIGWMKPVILLPIGALNALSSQQVEAILAHELAHIKRHDYLLNIIRSVVEVLFYFNPAVWWLSAQIRTEREHCCDDMALEVCGDSLSYVRALVALQELNRSPGIGLAMTLVNKKPELLNRVRRILNQPKDKSDLMEKLLITCLLLVCLCFTFVNAGNRDNNLLEVEFPREAMEPVVDDVEVDLAIDTDIVDSKKTVLMDIGMGIPTVIDVAALHLDTLPPGDPAYNGNVFFSATKDGKQYQIRIKDQKIVRLVVDGARISEDQLVNYYDVVQEILDDFPEPPTPPTPPAPVAPTRVSPPIPPTPPAPVVDPTERPEPVPAPPTPPAAPKIAVPSAPPPPPPPPKPYRIELKKPAEGGNHEDTGLYFYRQGQEETVHEVTQANNFTWRSDDLEAVTAASWVASGGTSQSDHIVVVEIQETPMRLNLDQLDQGIVVELKTGAEPPVQEYAVIRSDNKNTFRQEVETPVATYSYSYGGGNKRDNQWQKDLEAQLMADRLLEPGNSYQVEISADQLLINGKAQPAATHRKYFKLLQHSLDRPLGDDAMYFFNRHSSRRME